VDAAAGFFLSLATAFLAGAIASAAGIRLAQKLWPEQASKRTSSRTKVEGAEGKRSKLTPDN
jgi:hypothetical protein